MRDAWGGRTLQPGSLHWKQSSWGEGRGEGEGEGNTNWAEKEQLQPVQTTKSVIYFLNLILNSLVFPDQAEQFGMVPGVSDQAEQFDVNPSFPDQAEQWLPEW